MPRTVIVTAVLLATTFVLSWTGSANGTCIIEPYFPEVPHDHFGEQPCFVACPGAWAEEGHAPGSETDWKVCLRDFDDHTPIVGFSALRIDLTNVLPASICACEEECDDWPYVYPTGPTDANGCTTFRWRGSLLALDMDPSIVQLEIAGCGGEFWQLLFRSPDVNADCEVTLLDFVIFAWAFGKCPPWTISGYEKYTMYCEACEPCPAVGLPGLTLADLVVFARHFDHSCTPGSCDP